MPSRFRKTVTAFLAFATDFNYVVQQWGNLDEIVFEWLEHTFYDGHHKTLAIGRLRHSWKLAKAAKAGKRTNTADCGRGKPFGSSNSEKSL